MKYETHFSIFGKRMKCNITAKNKSEAKTKVRTKVAEQVKFEKVIPESGFEKIAEMLGVKL